tara:strand:- start:78 stop:677 length:600 start_codon:yes stop_codon:yes gene_type:complete
MEIQKEELDLFPTPVSLYDLSHLDIDVITEVIENTPKEEFYLVDGGKTDFNVDCYILDDPNLINLRTSIEDCLDDYSIRLGVDNIVIQNSWSSITEVGGRLELHRHEGCVVSGVFYPKLNEPISPLIVKSPISQNQMFEIYNPESNVQNRHHYNTIVPQSGMLVLFPSWLEHKTDVEVGRRNIISFNGIYDWVANRFNK